MAIPIYGWDHSKESKDESTSFDRLSLPTSDVRNFRNTRNLQNGSVVKHERSRKKNNEGMCILANSDDSLRNHAYDASTIDLADHSLLDITEQVDLLCHL